MKNVHSSDITRTDHIIPLLALADSIRVGQSIADRLGTGAPGAIVAANDFALTGGDAVHRALAGARERVGHVAGVACIVVFVV